MEYQRALGAQSEAIQFRTGVPAPDGTQLIYNANQRLRIAFERYTEALKNFTNHVLRRTTLLGGVHVLLIEDNNADVGLVERVVADGSVQVKIAVANNCAGALTIMSDDFKPHIVIADMGALEFGGVELMKRCSLRGIPVVIFSGSENPEDETEALRLGAKQFVRKPNDLGGYAEAVWKVIATWAIPSSSVATT